MMNFRRVFWFWVLLAGLLGPMLIVALMVALVPAQGTAGQGPSTASAAALRPGAPLDGRIARSPGSPLLLAGNVQGVWLAIPRSVRADQTGDCFELWEHPRNASEGGREVWRPVSTAPALRYFWGKPVGLSIVPGQRTDASGQTKDILRPFVVIGLNGRYEIRAFTNSGPRLGDGLPELQVPVAVAGAGESIYVLARGGERVTTQVAETSPATMRDAGASTAPGTAPATVAAPATRTVEVANRQWNLYAYHDERFEELPSMGAVSSNDAADTPTAGARPALIRVPGHLFVAWYEGTDNRNVRVRTLPIRLTKGGAKAATEAATQTAPATAATKPAEALPVWSRMVSSGAAGALDFRLLGFAIDQQAYVAWPTRKGAGYQLDGAAVNRDGTLASAKLFPMDISGISENIASADTDIAVGQSGTSVMVVVLGKDEALRSQSFNVDGTPGTPAQEIEPRSAGRNDAIIQNVMLILLVALLAVSLWQWRLRPVRVVLPSDVRLAPLRSRVLAGLIDIAIPYVVVLVSQGLLGEWIELLQAWFEGLARPAEIYGKHPALLWVLGGYIAHVTVGEMIFGRSIGKTVTGARVVGMDGKPARLGSILVRNLLKFFELGTGVLLIYVLITEHRQRLGDMIARTLVIEAAPTDGGSEGKKRSRRDDQVGAGKP